MPYNKKQHGLFCHCMNNPGDSDCKDIGSQATHMCKSGVKNESLDLLDKLVEDSIYETIQDLGTRLAQPTEELEKFLSQQKSFEAKRKKSGDEVIMIGMSESIINMMKEELENIDEMMGDDIPSGGLGTTTQSDKEKRAREHFKGFGKPKKKTMPQKMADLVKKKSLQQTGDK